MLEPITTEPKSKLKQRRFATIEEYEQAFAKLEGEVASLKSGLKSAAKTGTKATDFEKFLLGLEEESEEEDHGTEKEN